MPHPNPASRTARASSPRHRPRAKDETVKETFESIIIAFILAFVFRAYVVEAFVIPTGSMAPTLLGEHVRITCVQCGYQFTSDPDELRADPPPPRRALQARKRSYLTVAADAVCPMCHFPNHLPGGRRHPTRVSSGDRILVHKYIYSILEPRRWDVVVFKNPYDPDINFIKRLVGLPQEQLALVEGNVYVRSMKPESPGESGAWRIARKTDPRENRQALRVQRAVWRPVYHSQYVPIDVSSGRPDPSRARHPWRPPWVADDASGLSAWVLDGRGGYRHESAEEGTIRFDFDRALDQSVGLWPYNQLKFKQPNPSPVEDVRLAVAVMPDTADLSIRLQTTSRLDDPEGNVHVLAASIDPEGKARLVRLDPRTARSTVLGAPVQVGPLEPGRTRDVELWYVDQEASVWVDGRQCLVHRFDLPFEKVLSRRSPALYPEVSISIGGTPATLTRVELDRDLHYSGAKPGSTLPGRSVVLKPREGVENGRPLHLDEDEFFCLGDNSPWSHDGRFWNDLEPWIEHKHLSRKEGPRRLGIVPRNLLMGRAFFVYWPAPWRWTPDQMAFVPNFAKMRLIR